MSDAKTTTTTVPTTMAAWQRTTYGPAAGTERATLPVPSPARGEVLLRMRATALNAGDVRLMLGDPLLVRPVFGMRRPKYAVRGMDAAGTVVALGPAVTDVAMGDEVVVELKGGGGLAEYAVAPVTGLAVRPPEVTPEIAACLPIAAVTAMQAIDLAHVEGGHRVLVIGASGGVGTFVVQLATLRGAEVWATCGEPNRALVAELGAVRTFDYRATAVTELPANSFDAIIDVAGGTRLRDLRRLLTPTGTLAMVTGDGGHVLGPLPRMIRAAFLSIGSRRRLRPLVSSLKPGMLDDLLRLTATGRIAPVLERTYAWAEARAALERIESGHVAGKVVVRIGD
ncbi:MAG: NAD(P)-dependent alcohol dehydrogenase [Actinomycetota bacterium]